MPRVLNRETGREWVVPAGHFSLTDPVYEVLPDELGPEPAPVAAEVEPVAKPAPRARKNARKE